MIRIAYHLAPRQDDRKASGNQCPLFLAKVVYTLFIEEFKMIQDQAFEKEVPGVKIRFYLFQERFPHGLGGIPAHHGQRNERDEQVGGEDFP